MNADYNITPALTFSSQTGYNKDFLWSTEDYNRFNTSPDTILYQTSLSLTTELSAQLHLTSPDGNYRVPTEHSASVQACAVDNGTDAKPTGIFCDPQLGCSSSIVAQDLSKEHAWQLSQEFRLASNFTGPLNFSVGGNYMHYETVEDYYVFINTLTYARGHPWRWRLPPDTMPAWQIIMVLDIQCTPADNHECLS